MNTLKSSFTPFVCWLIISTLLLTIPGSAFPKTNWLDKVGFDKWVHFGMFLLMAWLGCLGFYKKFTGFRNLTWPFIFIGAACFIYGAGMEFIQDLFVRNRSFDRGDIAADAVGSTAGVIYSLGRYIKK
ncbi:MAG TPA: VanZ family protein [Chitinophagaceae bacterium]|nr:VanZ family protein [Chitinophagaceae bacterium]